MEVDYSLLSSLVSLRRYRYGNFLAGEGTPNAGCVGILSGKVDGFSIAGSVAGRTLSKGDFVVVREGPSN